MSKHHQKASQAIDAQHNGLSQAVVARQYELQAELWEPYGSDGRQKSVCDVGYHLTYLSEPLATSNPTLFRQLCCLAQGASCWPRVSQRGPGDYPGMHPRCPGGDAAPRFGCHRLGVCRAGPRSSAAGTHRGADFSGKGCPLASLVRQYLDALVRGERHVVSQLVLDAVGRGTSVKDVYLHVFQRSQYEIGRLWQMNQITVAPEHYCTVATQLIMSQLYPHLFSSERVGCQLVAACVGDELHELGARMVVDFFGLYGWDAYYLGANAPTESIVQAVVKQGADILGISAIMTCHVRDVIALLTRVRTVPAASDVTILVGGYPFNIAPDLWREVGADGHARDAQKAIEVANRMLRG